MRAISEKQKEKKRSIFVAPYCTFCPGQSIVFLAAIDFSTKLSSYGVKFLSRVPTHAYLSLFSHCTLEGLCNFVLLCAIKTYQVLEIELQKCLIYS
jgi:hypothetical protein